MFRILVAVDGSEDANKGVRLAARFAQGIPETEITLIYVISVQSESIISRQGSIEYQSMYSQETEDVFQESATYLSSAGIPYKKVVRIGNPAQEISITSSLHPFDLVVIGQKGRGKAGTTFIGSVTDKVLRRAHCPVLIVK